MTDLHTSITLGQLIETSFVVDRLIAGGMSEGEAQRKGELFARAGKSLAESGHSVHTPAMAVFVPGRIEVLGKHTDYCGGRSLICTVEKGMCFVATPNVDSTIRFRAVDLNEQVETVLDRSCEPAKRHWSNYPMTVIRRIARNFPSARIGADIALSSDLPPASGLSSSSAMIVGTFLVIADINRLSDAEQYGDNIRSTEDLAGYLGCIENGQNFRELIGDNGVGTFGGSQDHTAILCCNAGKLSVYSFCPVVHQRDISFPDELRFVVAHSGVIAEKTGDAQERYNEVSLRARRLVKTWNDRGETKAMCLRDVVRSGCESLSSMREQLDASLLSRLDQFIIESDVIIPQAADAFEKQNWRTLRTLVNASQQRAETDLRNQIPETITLQRRLMDSGAIAASAFGAGFGGSVWGLFRESDLLNMNLPSHFVSRPGCPAIQLSSAPAAVREVARA